MSGSAAIPMVSVNDGTRHFEFNDEGAFRAYLAATTSSFTSASLSAYIDEFKAFPMVDDVLITYFDESIKATENGSRLAPTILMGTVSELLIVRLLKSAGDYLEDPNVMHNYSNKRSLPAKQSYAIEVF